MGILSGLKQVAKLAAEISEAHVPERTKELVAMPVTSEVKPIPTRVPPKTPEQIQAIAQRIAPQLIGEEFVSAPKGNTSVAGKSQKQFALEKELQHNIIADKTLPPVNPVNLEKYKGNVMLSLPGDFTLSDSDIIDIAGNPLRTPSRQYGGPRYGLGQEGDIGWASSDKAAKTFQNRVNNTSEQYGGAPVLANYMMMGPEGMNFALHFSDAALKSIDPSKMNPEMIQAFNDMVKAGYPGKKGQPQVTFPNFAGIENPDEAYKQMATDTALRKHFNALVQQPTMESQLGMPSGMNIRHAVTEPELRNLEPGMTGYSLLEMNPTITHLQPSLHPTYSHDIPGTFAGRLETMAPYELMFPDSIQSILDEGKAPSSLFRTISLQGGRQLIDNQLLDEIGQYNDAIKRLTGKKEGGSIDLTPAERVAMHTEAEKHFAGGGDVRTVGDIAKQGLTELPMALADELAGLLRGSTKTTLGAPGDIYQLVAPKLPYRVQQILERTGAGEALNKLPTSEELNQTFTPVIPEGADPYRNIAAQAGESAGEWMPVDPFASIGAAGSAVGRGLKAADTIFSSAPSAGSRAAQRGVIKMPGGNWLNDHVLDKELKQLKLRTPASNRDPVQVLNELREVYTPEVLENLPLSQRNQVAESYNQLQQNIALNNWVDSNLGNYVKKQMGTESDPVRALAEEGITHQDFPNYGGTPSNLLKTRRATRGFPEHGMATSPEARAWEHASDMALRSTPAGQISIPEELATNQWLQKVPADTPINYLATGATEHLGFDKIVQNLKNDLAAGDIRPEQLNKISMPDAVQRVFEKNEAERKAKEAAELEAIKANLALNPYKEYPSGHKWVELPDTEASPENLKAVQDIGCQGGWCTKEADNAEYYGMHEAGNKLYALIDPSGKPHTQIHVSTTPPKEQSFTGLIPQDTLAQLQKQAQDIAAEKYKDAPMPFPFSMKAYTQNEYRNLVKQYRQENPEFNYPSNITQIKPFSNVWNSQMVQDATKKNPNYRQDIEPFLQDFVRSGNFADVQDLENAGLIPLNKTSDIAKFLQDAGQTVPKYLTQDELTEAIKNRAKTLGLPYKHGGKVKLEDQYRLHKLNGTISGTKYRM
jgi:hypothetical protein